MAVALARTSMVDPVFQSDNYVLARRLLDAAVVRQEAVAANIANAETPGYRRVDVSADFTTQLKAQLAAGKLKLSGDTLAPQVTEDPHARSLRPDGNTVEIEHELLALNRNAVEHEFLAEIITQNIKQLKMAITGHTS
ncbi:MAG: flagellar basal body rod protein FlgB [Opitutaceae bacterium]|jgi:flagellar basal-body rod protein FlgB